MVSGLISRRIWFAITDKIEDANFVWSQLKNLNFLKKQPSFSGEVINEYKGGYMKSSIWMSEDEKSFKNYFTTYLSSE